MFSRMTGEGHDLGDMFRFVLSIVVVVGGGYLWQINPSGRGELSMLIGSVIWWWMPQRKNGHAGTTGGTGT